LFARSNKEHIMARVSYPGVYDPKKAFRDLKPLRDGLIQMKMRCRPFHSDYLVLDAAMKALDTAAYHFTGEPDFYGLKPEQSTGGKA
jgi:hypothetical protein